MPRSVIAILPSTQALRWAIPRGNEGEASEDEVYAQLSIAETAKVANLCRLEVKDQRRVMCEIKMTGKTYKMVHGRDAEMTQLNGLVTGAKSKHLLASMLVQQSKVSRD